MSKQVKKVVQIPFEEIEKVSFEDFDKTMIQIVKAKLPQKKPSEKDKVSEPNPSVQP